MIVLSIRIDWPYISHSKELLSILDFKCPAGHTPARIINTSPEKGDITIRERSVGFQLQCYAKGTPTPTITFKRGKDLCVLINLNIKSN